jgi:hypothetical protein
MPAWTRVNAPELCDASLLFGARVEFDCMAYRP